MSGMPLVVSKRNLMGPVHCDPGGGITSCGYLCSDWTYLTNFGSLHSVTCRRCAAVLRKAGDL